LRLGLTQNQTSDSNCLSSLMKRCFGTVDETTETSNVAPIFKVTGFLLKDNIGKMVTRPLVRLLGPLA